MSTVANTQRNLIDVAFRVIMALGFGLLITFLLAWEIPLSGQVNLQAGEVAATDVVSPRQITYESDILTQAARDRAAQGVPDYYDPPQGRVRRQQVSRSREILLFINIVRADAYATDEMKHEYIAAIPDLALNPETIDAILGLSDGAWQAVALEVPLALDRGMREEIRESSLAAVRRRAAVLISTELDEESSNITVEIVRELIRPNSFLNTERSNADREAAIAAIPVQTNTLARGEIILRAGDIATPEDVESLKQLGLQQTSWDWWRALQAAIFSLTLLLVTGGAIYRLSPNVFGHSRALALPVVLSAIWLVAAKFMIIPHNIVPYIFPLAALGMLIAVLADLRIAVVMTLGFTLVIGYMDSSNLGLIIYLALGTLVGAVILGRAERLTAFLWAGLAITMSNLILAGIFNVLGSDAAAISSSQLLQTGVAVVLNGGLSASIALIGYFVMGNIFGITTSLQLTELSRPTHPLLRQLLLKAPGTYHHTILVSNLAERAAEAIGADAFLVRVGAYYHDIGKTVRPYFFVENIDDGKSPHEKLDPQTSAQILISHVTDGLDLGQKYRLPARILDFIREHHGAQMVRYFYIQASNRAQEEGTEPPDPADFSYAGPNPRTKETAILLLADTCEAAVRAERPGSRDALVALLEKLITDRVLEGALSNSDLTFKELETVKQTFVHILQGVHHPRIRYPEKKKKADGADSSGSPAKSDNGTAASEPKSEGSANGRTIPAPAGGHSSGPVPVDPALVDALTVDTLTVDTSDSITPPTSGWGRPSGHPAGEVPGPRIHSFSSQDFGQSAAGWRGDFQP